MMRRRLGRFPVVLVAVLFVAASLLSPVPASGELEHPRQQFLRDARAGLFIHWGLRTAPQHTSCAAWESDVTNGGWNARYWVEEARKLHAQYIVLATFHSRLGYARPWPSAVPGSCRTSRDFLGELVSATNAAGMRTILYLTDDPQWWNEGLPSGQSWLDSDAYSDYKGHDVDLRTRDGFGEYSQDLFVEVMRRYPDLGGFWIDNDNAYWERNGLYELVRSTRPQWTLSNNNEDTPIMDMISNEQKTGMSPAYDYPQAVYTAAPRLIEADYKLPVSGAWWYDGSNPAVDARVTLGRYVANAGSSIKSLMAETAQVNGRFPSNQEAFNNLADTYLGQIWGSIQGTEGGGYSYGGLKPGFWNDGAHGVTTVSRTDPDLHFVHVLTRPSGSTLRLRDNGYRITGVTNVRTGAPVSFSQARGYLTLTGVSTWDQYDTVFQVRTAGRLAGYPATMSASASASGHPAAHAADGDYRTYWDSDRTLPVSLRFDLGSAKPVRYLGINQREDSVAYARSATEQSARIREYRVYVSANGTDWGSPVATGTLPSHRGVAVIDLPATTTRHVRLEVVNTHAASSDSTRYQRLRVDEAWVGGEYAGGGGTGPVSVEAESATLSGRAVSASCTGCSGGAKVRFIGNGAANHVTFTVPAATAGTRQLTFDYTVDGTRSFFVSVNNAEATEIPVSGTSWQAPASHTVTVPLVAGTNTIRFAGDGANAPDLDRITLN